ncbi:MAG: CoA transferase [Mycobacterium sp.]
MSATGYGPDGPHAAKPGQDVLIEARTGWGQLNSVDGRPVPVASAVADTLGAMNGAFGTPARSCTRSAPVRASWCGPACTSLPLRAWRSKDFTF